MNHITFANMNTMPSLAELKQGAVILVDKPYRWTSFDAIHKLRKPVQAKIGHCGTLDPLATGLLICCTGSFTKKITDYQKLPKEYTGIIHLGAFTPTYDLESEPEDFKPYEHLSEADIIAATKAFTGDIMQVPPIHSAIKKDGKRAYELARKGEEIELAARPVTISEFEITAIKLPEIHFRVACSTGTYIRSLAHDYGQALGCGGYLQELRRTKIGDYKVEDAHTVAEWIEYLKAQHTQATPE
ncbi:tRNA pseudouridine(55) synthase TruB [Chitinophagaceae bacterium MMS25-I14]